MTHIVPIRHDVFSEIRSRRHLRRLVDVVVGRKAASTMTVDCAFLENITAVDSDAWFDIGDAFSDGDRFGALSELFTPWKEIKHPTVHAIYGQPHIALRTLTSFRRSVGLMGFDAGRVKTIRDVSFENASRTRTMDAELLSHKDIDRTRLFLESAIIKHDADISTDVTDVLVDTIDTLTKQASAETSFLIVTEF